MVKRRDPKTFSLSRVPTNEEIERFAAGADSAVREVQPVKEVPQSNEPNPTAKRDFKALRVPFNEYEFDLLEKAAAKCGRSKLNFMRYAMMEMAKEILE